MSKPKQQPPEGVTATVQSSDTPRHTKNKLPIIVAAVLVLTAAIVFAVMKQVADSPSDSKAAIQKAVEETGNTFVSSMQQKQLDAVHDQLTEETKSVLSPEDLEALTKESGGYLSGTLKKVETENPEGRAAPGQQLVEYEATGTDGKKYRLTITLVQEDGAWKILNFDKIFL